MLQWPPSQLPPKFAIRARQNKLIAIKPTFFSLLMELEKQNRVLRTIKLVPEDEIIAAVNVENFMDQPNRKCLNMLVTRYVPMRAHFEAKKCAQKHRFGKRRSKTNVIRKRLKSLNSNV